MQDNIFIPYERLFFQHSDSILNIFIFDLFQTIFLQDLMPSKKYPIIKKFSTLLQKLLGRSQIAVHLK